MHTFSPGKGGDPGEHTGGGGGGGVMVDGAGPDDDKRDGQGFGGGGYGRNQPGISGVVLLSFT